MHTTKSYLKRLTKRARLARCRSGPLVKIQNRNLRLAVVLLHDLDEVDNLVAVANLVIVPRNNFDELVGEIYTSVGVKD